MTPQEPTKDANRLHFLKKAEAAVRRQLLRARVAEASARAERRATAEALLKLTWNLKK